MPERTRPKIGLVLEGGGMRAGFVAGTLMAMADHGVTGFDLALAVSASVPTLAYFVTGQRTEMEKVWREELNTARLVRYRNIPDASLRLSTRRPIIDIDYPRTSQSAGADHPLAVFVAI